MKIEIIHNKHPLLGDVMILGKKHASSLGFFPQDAFIEHARKRWIFGATADGKLLGYLLFRINQGKQVIVITHLCIRPENRGAGISQQLIDQLKKRYGSELSGIALSCREDYVSASKLWTSYGFQARGRIRSRSKEENYLLKWYLDFGRANLFSEAGKLSHRTSALLDCNILVKLRDRSGSDSVEVKALLADWLADEVDFYCA